MVSEKEMSDINFERLKSLLVYIKNNLIDSEDNMYFTVDSLININNIITGSNNINVRSSWLVWNGGIRIVWTGDYTYKVFYCSKVTVSHNRISHNASVKTFIIVALSISCEHLFLLVSSPI